MSREAIKSFFRSQNRKPVIKPSNNVVSISTDLEESIMTGKSHDSELVTKYLSMFADTDQYLENTPQDVVEEPYKPDYSKYSIRLVEITDEMVYRKEKEEAYRDEEEYFKSFEAYVPPPRPKQDIDEEFEKMNYQLERCKKELDEELIKPIPNVKGYIPPTKKKEYNEEFNMNVRKLKSSILDLENGIKQVGYRINKENDRWIEHKKFMYRSEYIKQKLKELSAMQEEIANSSTM